MLLNEDNVYLFGLVLCFLYWSTWPKASVFAQHKQQQIDGNRKTIYAKILYIDSTIPCTPQLDTSLWSKYPEFIYAGIALHDDDCVGRVYWCHDRCRHATSKSNLHTSTAVENCSTHLHNASLYKPVQAGFTHISIDIQCSMPPHKLHKPSLAHDLNAVFKWVDLSKLPVSTFPKQIYTNIKWYNRKWEK